MGYYLMYYMTVQGGKRSGYDLKSFYTIFFWGML